VGSKVHLIFTVGCAKAAGALAALFASMDATLQTGGQLLKILSPSASNVGGSEVRYSSGRGEAVAPD